MLEFTTDEDLHTVMNYKRQVERERGYNGVICIDLNRLAEIHEKKCKLLADIIILSIRFSIQTKQL